MSETLNVNGNLIAENAYFWQHPDRFTFKIAISRLGGSYITQQLAKKMYTGGAPLWSRKLEELLYSVEMENTLGNTSKGRFLM